MTLSQVLPRPRVQVVDRVWLFACRHKKAIVLTFEVFWILVFLLDRIGGGTPGGVPQFVYVNF